MQELHLHMYKNNKKIEQEYRRTKWEKLWKIFTAKFAILTNTLQKPLIQSQRAINKLNGTWALFVIPIVCIHVFNSMSKCEYMLQGIFWRKTTSCDNSWLIWLQTIEHNNISDFVFTNWYYYDHKAHLKYSLKYPKWKCIYIQCL